MSEKKNTLHLKVITPERVLFDGEVNKYTVKVKGEVGDFSVLPNKSPQTVTLGLGKIIFSLPDGKEVEATLFGGYAVVETYESIIMTDVAEWANEIDIPRAEKAKERAQKRIDDSNADYYRALAALTRALVRIDVGNAVG